MTAAEQLRVGDVLAVGSGAGEDCWRGAGMLGKAPAVVSAVAVFVPRASLGPQVQSDGGGLGVHRAAFCRVVWVAAGWQRKGRSVAPSA